MVLAPETAHSPLSLTSAPASTRETEPFLEEKGGHLQRWRTPRRRRVGRGGNSADEVAGQFPFGAVGERRQVEAASNTGHGASASSEPSRAETPGSGSGRRVASSSRARPERRRAICQLSRQPQRRRVRPVQVLQGERRSGRSLARRLLEHGPHGAETVARCSPARARSPPHWCASPGPVGQAQRGGPARAKRLDCPVPSTARVAALAGPARHSCASPSSGATPDPGRLRSWLVQTRRASRRRKTHSGPRARAAAALSRHPTHAMKQFAALLDEPGLAQPRFTPDQDDRAPPRCGRPRRLVEHRQLRLTAHQGGPGPSAGADRGRHCSARLGRSRYQPVNGLATGPARSSSFGPHSRDPPLSPPRWPGASAPPRPDGRSEGPPAPATASPSAPWFETP